MHSLSLALLWVLASSVAYAAPLDDWLAAASAGGGPVFVAPNLDRAVGPLEAAAARLAKHPALDGVTEGIKEGLVAELGYDPLSLASHAQQGLRRDGPLLLSQTLLVLPVADDADAEDYLSGPLGLPLTPRSVAGLSGWQAGEWWAVKVPGALLMARDEGTLGRALTPATDDPLRVCPQQRGAADLFVLFDFGSGRGCVTGRFDAGRARFEARLPTPDMFGGMLANAAASDLLKGLGSDLTGAFAVRLGPGAMHRFQTAAMKLKVARSQAGASIIGAFDGQLAAASGPKLSDLTLVVGMSGISELVFDTLLGAVRPQAVTLNNEAPGRWRVELVEGALSKDLGVGAELFPKVGWIVSREGRIYLTTLRAVAHGTAGHLSVTLAGRGRLTSWLLNQPLLAYVRAVGRPHDGRIYADAAGPLRQMMSWDPKAVTRWASFAAYTLAHLSEVGLSARQRRGQLEVVVEVVHL